MTVQSIHFTADRKLLDLIDKKLRKLDTFCDRVINGLVYLRLEKSDNSANKITEIKLNLPGNTLFVKEKRRSFEEATDLAIESMCKQLKKHNRRIKNHVTEPAKEVIGTLLEQEAAAYSNGMVSR